MKYRTSLYSTPKEIDTGTRADLPGRNLNWAPRYQRRRREAYVRRGVRREPQGYWTRDLPTPPGSALIPRPHLGRGNRGRSRDRTPVVTKGTLPNEIRCRARAPKLEPAKIDSEFEDKALGHKAKQEEKRNEENRRDHCYSEEDNSGCVGHELRYSKVLWCEARILTLRGGGGADFSRALETRWQRPERHAHEK